MSEPVALTLAVLLLLANAFFVGAEFALIAARRSQIEPVAERGSRAGRATLHAMENISVVMAGAQLGITVCSLALGAVGEPAVAHLIEPALDRVGIPHTFLHPIAFVIAMTIVVCLHVVLGEMVPKNIALAGPERVALVLGPPMLWIVTVLRPLIAVLNGIANLTLRLWRVEPKDELSSTYDLGEVAAMLDESHGHGLLEKAEYDRLSGVVGFSESTVDSVVLPIDELAVVRLGESAAQVEELCAATGFSRFPVVEADGALAGYLHIKDVLEDDEVHRQRPFETDQVRSFVTVASGTPLREALELMQRDGAHLALAVDDSARDGEPLGIVALEDVLEELVGEIRDAAHHGPADPGDEQVRSRTRA